MEYISPADIVFVDELSSMEQHKEKGVLGMIGVIIIIYTTQTQAEAEAYA